jgi:DNA-binding Lrp family transcriptional regulator
MHKNLDLEILSELQKNGRASLRQIAMALGVATTTVSNRLSTLEEDDVIQGYRPVIDYAKLGFGLTVVIQLNVHGDHYPDVMKELVSHRSIISVYETTGDFDVVAIGKFKDTDGMNREIKRLLSNPHVEGTNTAVVLGIGKENSPLRLRDQ